MRIDLAVRRLSAVLATLLVPVTLGLTISPRIEARKNGVRAQQGPPPVGGDASSTAAFEVASIKRNRSGERGMGISMPPGGRFTATNVPVRQLLQHPDFSLKNPNRARSVIFSYCSGNPGAFHRADAAGYVFWSDRVAELDAINPQVAARLARALDRWKKLAEPYRTAAREAIARVAAKADLSNDVREVVTRALAD